MGRFDWTYDEVVLAADLVARNDWGGLRAYNPKVMDLSSLLRSASIHANEGRPENFRSVSSVQRKTFDIATQHPGYHGRPTRGGSHESRVVTEFIEEPERMSALARTIRAQLQAADSLEAVDEPDLEALSAHEGRVLAATHLRRERDPRLRQAKLDAVVAQGLAISCEVCGFDFADRYGGLGDGYIEVHHVLPLHASGPVITRLRDLALLCSNCHRMIHRARPWLTPGELRRVLDRSDIGNPGQARHDRRHG
ncbi:HNH endonuclease [Ornithinimicrobium avium]|nr:HNH endonuclease [Ornithinimicrobium avium]